MLAIFKKTFTIIDNILVVVLTDSTTSTGFFPLIFPRFVFSIQTYFCLSLDLSIIFSAFV